MRWWRATAMVLGELPVGSVVGTSSPRRAAQLRALGLGLEIRPLRGNLDTRLNRVSSGDLDAVVVARAGLARIGRLDDVTETSSRCRCCRRRRRAPSRSSAERVTPSSWRCWRSWTTRHARRGHCGTSPVGRTGGGLFRAGGCDRRGGRVHRRGRPGLRRAVAARLRGGAGRIRCDPCVRHRDTRTGTGAGALGGRGVVRAGGTRRVGSADCRAGVRDDDPRA